MTERDPDLSLQGFDLWLHGQAFPDADDPWSRELLEFSVLLKIGASTVNDEGALSKAALAQFSNELALMLKTLRGEAILEAGEASIMFMLTLSMRSLGRVEMAVDLRSYDGYERHQFRVDLDQSYLEPFALQVRACVASHPSEFKVRAGRKEAASSGIGTRLLDAIFGKPLDRS